MRNPLTTTRALGVDLLCLVLAFAVASGCTTLRPVPPSATGGYSSVKPGDKVRIVTRDGRDLNLVVISVADDSLVGNPPAAGAPAVTVAFSEITRIDKVQFSPVMGVPLGAGCVGAAVAFALAAVYFGLLGIDRGQDPGPGRPATLPVVP